MKRPFLYFAAALAAVALIAGPSVAQPAPATGAIAGKVVETMSAGPYTYVQVDDGSTKVWAAGPQAAVAVGDTVRLAGGMLMKSFTSKALGRTFDEIYFVNAIQVAGGSAGAGAPAAVPEAAAAPGSKPNPPLASAHGVPPANPAPAPKVDVSGILRADGGQTVAELFAAKAAMSGKNVAVRGRVVKFTPSVMGKNWIHVQDGSGASGDLTASTSATANVGDTVVVRGKLTTDKDLGYGYRYEIIVEDAAVTVE